MKIRGFSYAEAMVTMLIVAIIMVATTPIISKKLSSSKTNGSIWGWATKGGTEGTSTFFGSAPSQRVIIGNQNEGDESARLIVYEAADNRTGAAAGTLPPIMMFKKSDGTELGRLITDDDTVALGYQALNAMQKTESELGTTAIGAEALSKITEGKDNTAIGNGACSDLTSGSNNICIGKSAQVSSQTASDELAIGNIITAKKNTSGNYDVKINGNLFINPGLLGILDTSGTGNVATAITNASQMGSDIRLKNVLGKSTAGLNEINKIQVKKFTYKKDKHKKLHVGVIAQELREIFPNSVIKDKDGYLSVNREEMFFAMINAIKELCAKFNTQDAKVQKLEKEVEALKQENTALTQRIAEIEKKLNK